MKNLNQKVVIMVVIAMSFLFIGKGVVFSQDKGEYAEMVVDNLVKSLNGEEHHSIGMNGYKTIAVALPSDCSFNKVKMKTLKLLVEEHQDIKLHSPMEELEETGKLDRVCRLELVGKGKKDYAMILEFYTVDVAGEDYIDKMISVTVGPLE